MALKLPVYRVAGSDLPDQTIAWEDYNGDPVNFSTGYTFEARVGKRGQTPIFTKVSGITGAATFPNVTIAWTATGEIDLLTPGEYILLVEATRTSDNKKRKLVATMIIAAGTP